MLVLRADPWAPDHGMGFEAPFEEPAARAHPFVETEDWSTPRRVPSAEPGSVWFVDGVRRVDLRLLAEQDGCRAPGLFGTYAVGAVRCDGRANFDEHAVGRAVVLAGGLRPERVALRLGEACLSFEPATEPGSDPDRPLWGLQQLMRRAEGALAARTASERDRLVLVDGRLGFTDPTASPVVGVVKRSVRLYLDTEHEALLPRLAPGERTPLFGLGDEDVDGFDRHAWYTRLVALRAPWHPYAGLVRCEVRAGLGLPEAVRIADRLTGFLPAFAGRPTDPRFPQNLAPVGALEVRLRHRMGHRGIVRRALTAWLTREGG